MMVCSRKVLACLLVRGVRTPWGHACGRAAARPRSSSSKVGCGQPSLRMVPKVSAPHGPRTRVVFWGRSSGMWVRGDVSVAHEDSRAFSREKSPHEIAWRMRGRLPGRVWGESAEQKMPAGVFWARLRCDFCPQAKIDTDPQTLPGSRPHRPPPY